MNFTHIETVNFYGDMIDVAISDQGQAYVSVSQITGYLGLDLQSIVQRFENDPRVEMTFLGDEAVVHLVNLNGFLMLLPYDEVPEEMKQDLLRYQVECFKTLHDYWIHGVAINRRETPFDITSKFRDERAVSRAAMTKACAKYYKDVEGASELGLPSDLFDKVLAAGYRILGLDPKHEYEKLSGAEARYLAWIESVFARTIDKFATWGEQYDDVVAEASVHVEKHLRETGDAWIAMADNVPATLYR